MAGPFGTPSATVGISAPASLEMEDASGAMMPSGVPVPNFRGSLEVRMAWPYERKFAAVEPIPGIRPHTTPRTADRNVSHGY
jgi:hypothetical protein